MGGDHAPLMVLQGLGIAAVRPPGARFFLVGDEAPLHPLLQQHRRAAPVCDIRHAPEAIGNETKPTAALRVRGSSMRIAIDAVAGGEASGVVTAGNTGALLALAK